MAEPADCSGKEGMADTGCCEEKGSSGWAIGW